MTDNDPLAGLDDIPWAGLEHAYGSAADVPDLLREVQKGTRTAKVTSLEHLANRIVHQGTRDEATRYAVPFLARLALDRRVPDRPAIVRLLAEAAIGLDSDVLPDPYDPAEDRAELAAVRARTDDWESELDQWIAEASDESERELRRQHRGEHQAQDYVNRAQAPVLAYDAVHAEVAALSHLLAADSPDLRAATAYLLAWFPESAQTLVPLLTEFVSRETEAGPAATAMVALGLLGEPDGEPGSAVFLRGYLDAADAQLRWGAAVALSRLGETDPAVTAALAASVADAPRGPYALMPFLGSEDRYRDLAALALDRAMETMSAPVIDALLTGLLRSQGFMTGATIARILVDRLFSGDPPWLPPSTPPLSSSFADLDEQQQRLLRTLAHRESPWSGLDRPDLHQRWIPERREELRAYVGLEASDRPATNTFDV